MNNLSQIEALLFVAGDEGMALSTICSITQFDKPAVLNIETLASTMPIIHGYIEIHEPKEHPFGH